VLDLDVHIELYEIMWTIPYGDMNYIRKYCWLSSKPREDRSSPYALTFFNIRMVTYAFVMGGNYPQTRKFRNIRPTVQEGHGATVNVYAQRYSTSLNSFHLTLQKMHCFRFQSILRNGLIPHVYVKDRIKSENEGAGLSRFYYRQVVTSSHCSHCKISYAMFSSYKSIPC